ncbi:Photosystem II reaction center protein Z [Platanthera guangdongensis]|uniref:Photosystem II reaction center protein Z n=1 Tax=Platanthera guangdongensis TaxID=2320717 RepID=A0ABR2ML16_9ASPA
MTIAFQLAVFALIATSLILLISVPVVFASSDDWSSNKNVVFSGTSFLSIVSTLDHFCIRSILENEVEHPRGGGFEI